MSSDVTVIEDLNKIFEKEKKESEAQDDLERAKFIQECALRKLQMKEDFSKRRKRNESFESDEELENKEKKKRKIE